MAFVERWMRLAVCGVFPELPWLEGEDQVTPAEVAGMRGACRSCGVIEVCQRFVESEGICGGFWAGEFREATSFRQARPAGDDARVPANMDGAA
jgi:hypothetical protein